MVGVELFVQVLVIVVWMPPHPNPLPRRGEVTIVRCRSIAASLFGFARAITGYSFLIQNTASPMSPDHRSSGRFLVGEPFGVSQFLSVVVL